MYDPNRPPAPDGMMQTLGAGPKPDPRFGVMNALSGHPGYGPNMGNQKVEGWRDAWHAARPDRGSMNPTDWRNALMGWRDMKHQYKFGQQPTPVAAPPMSAPAQTLPTPVINGQLPLSPYGG